MPSTALDHIRVTMNASRRQLFDIHTDRAYAAKGTGDLEDVFNDLIWNHILGHEKTRKGLHRPDRR